MQVFQAQLSPLTLQIVFGAGAAALICLASVRLRLLSASGAAAAFFVGAAVFGVGGWRAAVPLLVFFITSNAWGRWRRARKKQIPVEKSGPRDAWQVLANGGLPAAAILLTGIVPHRAPLFALAFAAAVAEANADTWATEVGAGAAEPPRLITTFKAVPVGRSGAVSLAGTLAAVAGALLIGATALPLFRPAARLQALAVGAAAGFAGALIDSVLGATVQASEDGRGTGICWIGNDLVNFLSSSFACLVAAGAALLLGV